MFRRYATIYVQCVLCFIYHLETLAPCRDGAIYSIVTCMKWIDRLCGLVVRVPDYRSRGPGLDSRRYQIF
jgi:hypothetical protein